MIRNRHTMNKQPAYLTGECIRPGDKLRLDEWEGTVDFVITRNLRGWDANWQHLGGGVRLKAKPFGSVYTRFDDEDLSFVARPEGTQ
jgi:hypothetical protein